MRILLLLLLVCVTEGEDDFDFHKFNYCKIKCGKFKHTCCNLKPRSVAKYINDSTETFRESMVNLHNEWRNYIASGQESTPSIANREVSNMLIVSYSLELEHIAWCRGCVINSFDHDKCRNTHDNRYTGQNLYGGTAVFPHKTVVHDWYVEVKDITEKQLEHYGPGPNGQVGHFTELAWWSVTHIGCIRFDTQVNVLKYIVVCNYQSKYKHVEPNWSEKKTFNFGPKCSECPFGTNCTTPKYPALCGTQEPIPKDDAGPETNNGKIEFRPHFFILLQFLLLLTEYIFM